MVQFDIKQAGVAAISFTDVVAKIAVGGEKAIAFLDLVAPWLPFPFVAAIVHTLDVAAPYVTKVAQAAPIVEQAIAAGVPIAEAIQQHGPDLLGSLKEIFAIASNNAPYQQNPTAITAADVSDHTAAVLAGIIFTPGRTNEEQQREWGRAQGQA